MNLSTHCGLYRLNRAPVELKVTPHKASRTHGRGPLRLLPRKDVGMLCSGVHVRAQHLHGCRPPPHLGPHRTARPPPARRLAQLQVDATRRGEHSSPLLCLASVLGGHPMRHPSLTELTELTDNGLPPKRRSLELILLPTLFTHTRHAAAARAAATNAHMSRRPLELVLTSATACRRRPRP